jgi:hypothetical protein
MPFEPYVNQELVIDAGAYRIVEHPAAPGMPFGQEGRQAIVYQLSAQDDLRALKVFRPRFRAPSLVSLADQIAPLASLPGLQVCQRVVLTPSRHAALLREFPDLIYAVLMPWVEGPVWQEILLERRTLTAEQSLRIARALARVLLTMEERGVAHCDLSAPNLILSPDLDRPTVALVDVEGIYAPGLPRPGILPAGSPGYAHKTAPRGLWNTEADRFAGAVLLAEILGRSIPEVRQAAWGENYFSAQEMQLDNERYQVLVTGLRRHWGDTAADLFARAWHSDTLMDCPTLGEWLVGLPERAPALAVRADQSGLATAQAQVIRLVMQAEQAAGRGETDTALDLYRQAAGMAPPELADEITARIQTLRPAPEPAGPPCRHCGRELPLGSEICPHCERGQEEPLPSPEDTPPPPTWRCPNCGRYAPAAMELCPHCERGRRDGTAIAPRPPAPPEAPVARESPVTFWSCPHCGRAVPPARDLCPHCLRGRRDGTVEGALAPASAKFRTPSESEPIRSTAAAPSGDVPLSPFARWAPVLILGVAWALGWYVGRDMAGEVLNWWYRTQGPVASNVYQVMASAVAGALVGLITGLVLRWMEGSVRARQVLLLALGWALGSAAGSWISWTVMRSPYDSSLAGSLLAAVGGVVGGLMTGLILRGCGSLPRWRQLIWVVGGYAVAWFLASMAGQQLARIEVAGSGYLASLLRYPAFGALAGAIGGVVLYWQLGQLTGRGVTVPAAAARRRPPSLRRSALVAAVGWGACWALGHILGEILFSLVAEGLIPLWVMTTALGLLIGAALGVTTGWLLGRLGHPLSVRQWIIVAAVWGLASGVTMILVTSPTGTGLAEALGWWRPSFVFMRKYGYLGPRAFRLLEWLLGWPLAALAAGVTVGLLRRPSGRPVPWRRILIIAVGFALAWAVALYAAELALQYLLMPLERSVGLRLSLVDSLVDFLTGALAGAAAGALLHWQLAPGPADQRERLA